MRKFWGGRSCDVDGHRFEPRYSDQETELSKRITTLNHGEAHGVLYIRIYVRDVCLYCGQAIERTVNAGA